MLTDQTWISVFGRLAYMREFNEQRELTAESLAARGFAWNVEGLAAPSEALQVDLGLNGHLTDGLDVTLKGSYTGYDGGSQRSGSVTFSYKF